MSYIPTQSTSQSVFALETGFDSVIGTIDATYNPRIIDGSQLHHFFTRQSHYVGKYVNGITTSTSGITFPQGWYFVLDPSMYYSSGTTQQYTQYLTWNINGVDVLPRFQSHYLTDQPAGSNASYRGLRFLDCSASSQTVKIIARGAGWASMGNCYFDNQQGTTNTSGRHKSNIMVYAINATTYQNPTVRTLDASEVQGAWASGNTIPQEGLNKFWVNTIARTGTITAPTPTQAGDWFGFMQLNNDSSSLITIVGNGQTLVSNVAGNQTNTNNNTWKWVWTGIRWVEVPISQDEFIKFG